MKSVGWALKVALFSLGMAALIGASSARAEEKKSEEPKKEEKPKKDVKDMTADELEEAGRCPVCRNEHKLVYHFDVGGKTYHFATRKCYKEFSENPAKFGVKPDEKKETAKKDSGKTAPPSKEEKTEDAGGMMGQ
ncbi:MAG: hypothetical protein HY291_07450 [Planctomycetes bacterium]|nr:hypothetical protein [Planctomycetota bacterium]